LNLFAIWNMKSGTTFTSALLSWYDANGRDLPWRSRSDPYAVLVSEFMLQQTTVPAVIPFFLKWMDRYPSIEELARADEAEILRDWEGLGYYSRARNLHAAAREVVRQYGGSIPDDPGHLKKLPGIGGYTSAAVASIAFGVRVPAADANSLRVWSRLLVSPERKHIREVFSRILPMDRPGDFNQALMDLGSLVCTSRDPECPACPVSTWCRACNSGRVSEFPARKTPPDTERIEAAVGILFENDRVLVQKRPETGLLAGLWEFPGGKIQSKVQSPKSKEKDKQSSISVNSHKQFPADRETKDELENEYNRPERITSRTETSGTESPEEAVVREVREETGLRVQVCGKLGVFTHSYTRYRVKLHVFLCQGKAGTLHRPEARWVTLEEMERLPMPSVNRRIVRALEKHLTAEEKLNLQG
jgi:A/G-specific adenine glycosylase